MPLFYMFVGADDRNSSQNIIQVRFPSSHGAYVTQITVTVYGNTYYVKPLSLTYRPFINTIKLGLFLSQN